MGRRRRNRKQLSGNNPEISQVGQQVRRNLFSASFVQKQPVVGKRGKERLYLADRQTDRLHPPMP